MNISSGRITPPRASVAGCVVAPRDHTIEVRHLFGKRFVSVLSFWCLTRRKPLILLDGASSAGIANGLWVRSQFGSPGSEANQFQLMKSAWRRPAAIPSPPAADFPDRRPYFPLSLGSLIGTCREVLTILGLPSGWVRLMTVSRRRMNFSASMGVASLMAFSGSVSAGGL
jgi:hypothetical protein